MVYFNTLLIENDLIGNKIMYFILLLFLVVPTACRSCLGQGSNMHLSHSRDNTESLMARPPGNSQDNVL